MDENKITFWIYHQFICGRTLADLKHFEAIQPRTFADLIQLRTMCVICLFLWIHTNRKSHKLILLINFPQNNFECAASDESICWCIYRHIGYFSITVSFQTRFSLFIFSSQVLMLSIYGILFLVFDFRRILNCGLKQIPDLRFLSTGTILNTVWVNVIWKTSFAGICLTNTSWLNSFVLRRDLEGNQIEIIDTKTVNIRSDQLWVSEIECFSKAIASIILFVLNFTEYWTAMQ